MNKKIIFFSVISFLFICGLLILNQNSSETDETIFRALSSQKEKSKQNKIDRNFDLGTVSDEQKKIVDEPSVLFNDPAIKQAWGLKKADAARAWSITQGDKNVVVAIIDTGIDIKHEDLKNNLWINGGEYGLDKKGQDKAKNGIDDDNNGFIDDVHGWNFVSQNNNLEDNHGHGTHIAGIIGAEAGNNKGISGISPQVSLMILKYYDPKVANNDNLKNTIKSIKYAIQMGAHIINYSGGGTEFSQEEFDAIAEAEKRGILFVAAAGNERSNSDEYHYYPADYKLNNIISVTAIDPETEVLSSSNFGVETVDLAAPGQSILSCLPNNSYGVLTGTSQATAFVSGAGVLVMSHKDLYNKAEEVKKFILATGDTSKNLESKTKTAKQLNLFKALTILGQSTTLTGVQEQSQQKRTFSINSIKEIDPNLEDQSIKRVGQTGFEILNALDKMNKKKKNDSVQAPRLGTTQPNKPDTEN